MATFLDILLLALIVATTGNLILNFKGKKQDFRSNCGLFLQPDRWRNHTRRC